MALFKKLSVIIPVYNEERTIATLLERVRNVTLSSGIEKEVIVINDASTDKTEAQFFAYQQAHTDFSIKYLKHAVNQGKGAAIHSGIALSEGQYLIIQDADLEYDPDEFNVLIAPVLKSHADVVYGSRFVGGKPHRILFFWHTIGNKFLTTLSNMFTDLNLTDMEVGYKLIRTDIIKKIPLEEKRFGFEPEITAKVARIPKLCLYEVGISYYGRTYEEGKKINWKDGVKAIYCILKYNIWSPYKP